ncbi:MAG: hypothetical protein KGO82_18990 [Bacteroidota bacterium]|nr:hypothetical protein [Bacteroidota bacterium]
MDFETFIKSIQPGHREPDCNPYALALWHERMGDWHKAHQIVQDMNDDYAAWVHAYLHRREGDQGNAGYWYRIAGKPFPTVTMEEEWRELVKAVLQ